MKKKTVLLISVLLFIGFFFFFVFYSAPAKEAEKLEPGALAGSVRQAEQLQRALIQEMDAETLRLCFRGEELACDRKTRTWYLPVDMENPDWEAGTFGDFEGEIQILPLLDYTLLDKQETVARGQAVPFLAFRGEEAAVINVVFTGLPVIRIETDADLDVDTVFAGSAAFYEDCGRESWVTASAFQAHERGQTTRAYPKKGYRLNLITVTPSGVVNENEKSIFGMRQSDSWILYAMYSDGTKIRDKFNIELWNRFGAENTPYDAHYGTHMEYAELFVNGEYRGLYGLMEPIDSSQLAVSDQEYLYKRTYGRELASELFDLASPEEYLSLLGMEIKGRDGAGSRADWRCFQDFVKLCEADDAEFEEGAQALFSMANVADLWIYLQMLYGEDNIYKNMFFAFKKESGGYRLYLVPWDVDLTWGNVYVDDARKLYVEFAPELSQSYLEWPLADRMLKLDVGGIREMVKARWRELRGSVLSGESMAALLEECRRQVQASGAFARDALRWPDSRHDGNYEGLEAFMDQRMEYLDEMLKNLDE